MENKINIAELLRDCPKGMELDCLLCNNPIELEDVVYNEVASYPIRAVGKDGFHHVFTSYGASYNHDDAKCVIFPKGKTTWERFQRPFKDGDIVVSKGGDYIFMLKKANFYPGDDVYKVYNGTCYFGLANAKFLLTKEAKWYFNRLATEEEKQKLFQAVKDNGYRWNEETKSLEKLAEPKFKVGDKIKSKENRNYIYTITGIREKENKYECGVTFVLRFSEQDNWELVPNKFDINSLVPFESRVLVRHDRDNKWCGSFFSHIDEDFHSHCYKFVTAAGKSYPMCIPYEGNEHLIGKTDDCSDFYKTWK